VCWASSRLLKSASSDGSAAQLLLAADYLCALQAALRETALVTRFVPPGSGPVRLVVVNPEAPALSEVVHAKPHRSGESGEAWFFCWSWDDWICGAEQVTEAVTRIFRLLQDITL
jgi:hypothetical protein